MSIIIVMRDRFQLEIQGYEPEAQRVMRARRSIAVKSKKLGRTMIIRPRDIMLAEVITAAEERALVEKAVAEAKLNPNPGRDPKLTTVKKN